MRFSDMKISTRLTAGFGILVLLIAFMGGTSIIKIHMVEGALHTVLSDYYRKIAELNEIKGNLNQVARSLRNMVIMTAAADIEKEREQTAATQKTIADQWARLEAKIISDKGRAELAKVNAARGAYGALQDKFLGLVAAGNADEARNMLLGELRPGQLAYFAAVEGLIQHQDNRMEESTSEAIDAVERMKATIWASGAVALLVAVCMATWIIRAITRPINQAVRVSAAVAAGDLSLQFDASGNSETARLMRALKDMQANLVRVIAHVRENAEGVASASQQIADGNRDLSGRTEEQASALEQTAASMEELSSTVRQNADNALQANQFAIGATTVARKGGDVVGQVVGTMKEINDSSRKIADIIGVIDSIAFQTNILALNAAVEAARAGEQGRGFAVVAGEVRNLAQRSAEAAKEIKTLITASVERVEQGTAMVDHAGATMTEIVTAIKRVTDIMGEISAASTEQSAGVAQIETAMSQMDQATQQNAALVEQSSAASESLHARARQLVQAVAVFKLQPERGGHGAPCGLSGA